MFIHEFPKPVLQTAAASIFLFPALLFWQPQHHSRRQKRSPTRTLRSNHRATLLVHSPQRQGPYQTKATLPRMWKKTKTALELLWPSCTLQILLKDLGLVPHTRAARPCLCATNHLLVLTPHIYFVYILFLVHGFLSSVFRWCHHVKVVLRNKMWLYHDVALLKNVFSHLRKIVSSLLEVCDVVFQCCSEVAYWLFFCCRFFSTFRDTNL